jgi:hypothetical protein
MGTGIPVPVRIKFVSPDSKYSFFFSGAKEKKGGRKKKKLKKKKNR